VLSIKEGLHSEYRGKLSSEERWWSGKSDIATYSQEKRGLILKVPGIKSKISKVT
jgi:hypothetical protein